MAVIKTYKSFNGNSMGVAFSDGEGKTDNPWLIQRFKESGYQVEESKEDEKEEQEESKEDEKDESASTKKASPAKTRSAASKTKAK